MRLFSSVLFIFLSIIGKLEAASSLSYSGRLVQANGAPVNGPVNLRAELVYTDATSTILCFQNLSSVALTKGVFHLKIDFDCTPSSLSQVLQNIPATHAVAIRIIDQSNAKTYPLQALHAIPLSIMAEQLPRMGASTGQALAWDGTKWAPTAVGTGNGTVTNIITGTGLTGGPISTTGTISIATGGVGTNELAANAVTSTKINSNEITNSHISSSAAIDYSKLNIPNTTIPYAKLLINDGDIPASKVSGLSGVIDDILASVITNGDITHAPTGDAVFDALALKADTTNIAQTITALAVTGLGAPSFDGDATNKLYVDNAITTVTNTANGKVSKTGDTMTGSLSVTGTVSATNFSGDGSGLTGVSVDPNSNIQLSGETAKTIGVLRRTAPDSTGTNLTINSSGATSGATNKNGGNLVLSSGAATGYGSSLIEFNTAGGGTTGTADVLPTTKMIVDGNGHVGIGVTSGLYHDLTIKRNTPGATTIQLVDNASGVASSDGVTMSLNGSVYGLKHQETGGVIRFSTLEDSYAMEVKGDRVGINRYNPGSHLDISLGGLAATDALRINSVDAAAGDLLIVKPNGNVGIGVLAPTQKLDVAGNINATQLCIAGDCKSSWPSMTVGAGSVTTTEIADGTIQTADLGNTQVTYAKLNLVDGDIPLAKLNGASDATKYLRGDKTWSTFATDAINSVLSTFTVGTGTKPAVVNTDTVVGAFGKVQKTLNDINADYVSKTADQVIFGSLAINSTTGFITVPTPINPNDAANKAYVDGFGQWLKNGSNIYYNSGFVGIGTNTPSSYPLEVKKATSGGSFDPTIVSNAPAGRILIGSHGSVNKIVSSNSAGTAAQTMYIDGPVADVIPQVYLNTNDLKLQSSSAQINFGTSRLSATGNSYILGGNLGIGTSSPTTDIMFNGNTNRTISLSTQITNAGANLTLKAGDAGSTTTDQNGGTLILSAGGVTGSGTSSKIEFKTISGSAGSGVATSPTTRMTLTGEGYLGLATATPTGRIDIKGSGQGGPGNGAAFNILRLGNASALDFGEYAGGDTWIQSSNRSTYATKQNLILNPDGGNIGIGTSSPGAKLEVAGLVKITGGTPGLGKVLTSDATGLASWTTIAGGDFKADGTVPMTGVMKLADGTGAAPSLSFAADLDTGIFRPANDAVAVSLNGVERLRLSHEATFNNGRLGINTNPGRALHVSQQTVSGVVAQFDSPGGSALELKKTSGVASLYLKQDASNNFMIDDNFAEANPSFFIAGATGNVGIGTSSPGNLLSNNSTNWAWAGTGLGPTSFNWRHTSGGYAAAIVNTNNAGGSNGLLLNTKDTSGGAFILNATYGINADAQTGTNSALAVLSNGNVGIGTTTPSEKLEVSGNVKATEFLYSSDERLKHDIKTLSKAIDKVLKLRGVEFKWNKNDQKTVGFIAQEVEKVLPELVKTDKYTSLKSVQYGNLVALLVEALKEENQSRISAERKLSSTVEKMQVSMKKLEDENKELKKRLDKIEKYLNEKR